VELGRRKEGKQRKGDEGRKANEGKRAREGKWRKVRQQRWRCQRKVGRKAHEGRRVEEEMEGPQHSVLEGTVDVVFPRK
jgi:hypothetical protein